MNDPHENQQPPESTDERIERLQLRKIRLETQLIEAGMRHDRFRFALDIVKWSAIGAAVVLAYLAANHVGVI